MHNQVQQLKSKVPINSLSEIGFFQATRLFRFTDCKQGEVVFKVGDTDNHSVYLLEGRMALTSKDGKSYEIDSGCERARYPLSNLKPRQFNAIAKSETVTIARIPSVHLDRLVTWDSITNSPGTDSDLIEFTATGNDVDWISSILRSEEFARIPPENMERLLGHMEEVVVPAGQVIIRQGEPGDHYYIIKQGVCGVSRHGPVGEIELARIGPGDAFGESALASGLTRDATVTMLEDGVLKRLPKKEFEELLTPPLIPHITYDELQEIQPSGVILIDVRSEDEFARESLKGAINIPFYFLRMKMKRLSRKVEYIMVCDTGSRSKSATFLMNQKGFNAFVLDGGLNGIHLD